MLFKATNSSNFMKSSIVSIFDFSSASLLLGFIKYFYIFIKMALIPWKCKKCHYQRFKLSAMNRTLLWLKGEFCNNDYSCSKIEGKLFKNWTFTLRNHPFNSSFSCFPDGKNATDVHIPDFPFALLFVGDDRMARIMQMPIQTAWIPT